MSWIVLSSILGCAAILAAFGVFDDNGNSGDDGDTDPDPQATAGDDTLSGTGGILSGLDGDDDLTVTDGSAYGNAGDDDLTLIGDSRGYGGADDDTVEVGAGATGFGGNGDDALDISGAGTAFGDAGNDIITAGIGAGYGGSGNDSMSLDGNGAAGLGGSIHGDDGSDTLNVRDAGVAFGDAGNDTITLSFGGTGHGGIGNDMLSAQLDGGFSELFGDAGNDTLTATGNVDAFGGNGKDDLYGRGLADMFGGNGEDVLIGNMTDEEGGPGQATSDLFGGANNDTLWGAGDGALISGGEGADLLIGGGAGNNLSMEGGAGTDTFAILGPELQDGQTITIRDFTPGDHIAILRDQTDTDDYTFTPSEVPGSVGYDLTITRGTEVLNIRIALDGLDSTEGTEPVTVRLDPDTLADLSAPTDAETLRDIEPFAIFGTDGNDTLVGSGSDSVFGGRGADALSGDSGVTFYGGGGDDSIDGGFDGANAYGDAGNDTLDGFTGLYGGDGGDHLSGYSQLYGGSGNDTIEVENYGGESDNSGNAYGGDGQDTISAGTQQDAGGTLFGGNGDDLVSFHSGKDVVGGAGDDTLIANQASFARERLTGMVTLGEGDDLLAIEWPSSGDAARPNEVVIPHTVTDFTPGEDQLAIILTPGSWGGYGGLKIQILPNAEGNYTDIVLRDRLPSDEGPGYNVHNYRLTGVSDLDPADVLLFADAAAVAAGTPYGTLASPAT